MRRPLFSTLLAGALLAGCTYYEIPPGVVVVVPPPAHMHVSAKYGKGDYVPVVTSFAPHLRDHSHPSAHVYSHGAYLTPGFTPGKGLPPRGTPTCVAHGIGVGIEPACGGAY